MVSREMRSYREGKINFTEYLQRMWERAERDAAREFDPIIRLLEGVERHLERARYS